MSMADKSIKKGISETELFDEFGDLSAISASLDDILKFIKQHFPDLKASVHYEDYDDYGCEHYIIIEGECAYIELKKDYGGILCPANSIICSVMPYCVRDSSTSITHRFHFKEGAEAKKVLIGSNYAEQIKDYLDNAIKYLEANSDIFYRIDTRYYSDGRGVHQRTGVAKPYSYDLIYVSDDDFYTDKELNLDIQSYKKDVDSVFEAERARERFIFNTKFGAVLLRSPLEVEPCDGCPKCEFEDYGDDVISCRTPVWTATHVVNEPYPDEEVGRTLKEAYDNLLTILKQEEECSPSIYNRN